MAVNNPKAPAAPGPCVRKALLVRLLQPPTPVGAQLPPLYYGPLDPLVIKVFRALTRCVKK
jgi:hypothetical protein